MSLLTIVAANVLSSVPNNAKRAIAGATLTAGELIYIDTDDSSKAKLVLANGTAIQRKVAGITLVAASAGQPVLYIDVDANLQIGASGMTIGDPLFSNATAGRIGELADQATGDYPAFVGIVNSATTVNFSVVQSSGVKP